jgi:hypothetical protein
MVDKNSLLIVTDLAWFDDYSQQKYHCIHLTVTHANISEVDLFMLAASRLYHKGEFLIKLSTPLGYNNLTSMATKFNFERINTHQTLSNQLVFRFSGRETKTILIVAFLFLKMRLDLLFQINFGIGNTLKIKQLILLLH